MIPVTKPYLPGREKIDAYIDSIYETSWLTNSGPLVHNLTLRLAEYLGLDPKCLVLVGNGSLALHLAYKALELKGDVITTPFSFIATTSTLKWEGLNPVFADIDQETWNIDARLIEEKITPNTSAIVPVHVFGNPCDVDAIQGIADKHDLKVVYDASHCFGVALNGESVLTNGDVSTISFHATKLFHTAEGGAVVTKTPELADKIQRMINFGIDNDTGLITMEGTNAKMSEFHAAVGLAVLDDIDGIRRSRLDIWEGYEASLAASYLLQKRHPRSNNNHAYFPLVLRSAVEVSDVIERLARKGVQARRYFYPSLDTIDLYDSSSVCDISRNISSRILCIPCWQDLDQDVRETIIDVLADRCTA